MARKMEFDALSFSFKKVGRTAKDVAASALTFLLLTVSLAVMVYVAVSLIWSTDTEKRLRDENRMYEKMYSQMLEREDMLEATISHLQHEDNDIYGYVFHSVAPDIDPMAGLDLFHASDSIPPVELAIYSAHKTDSLMLRSAKVEQAFRKAFARLGEESFSMPPMHLPLKDVKYPQTGASTGQKMNPFLKAYVNHEGLDFIVSRGEPVYASAAGTVISASNSRTDGRKIEISHAGGYVTVYSHLDEMSVKSGQTVRLGQKIGTVGMSGKSYAPHLHYGIRFNGDYVDPVNYLFASVTPEEYANMLFMSVNTMQSMD